MYGMKFPRDYEMPTKDPDKEDETTAENKKEIQEMVDEINKMLKEAVATPAWVIPKAVSKAEITELKLPESKCNHKWVAYTGLVEQFEYCEHCDEKRK